MAIINRNMKKRGWSRMEDALELSQRIANACNLDVEAVEATTTLIFMDSSRNPEALIHEWAGTLEQPAQNNGDDDHGAGEEAVSVSSSSSSPTPSSSSSERAAAVVVAAATASTNVIVYDRLPEIGYNFQGSKLSRFPPQENLRDIVGNCSHPFSKQLTVTDLSTDHYRLSFGKEDVYQCIFPILDMLDIGKRELKTGMEVSVYDPRGEEYTMTFKSWSEEKVYVLNGKPWLQLVGVNNLQAFSDWVNVWAFWKRNNDGKLCFALEVERFNTPKLIKRKRREKEENQRQRGKEKKRKTN